MIVKGRLRSRDRHQVDLVPVRVEQVQHQVYVDRLLAVLGCREPFARHTSSGRSALLAQTGAAPQRAQRLPELMRATANDGTGPGTLSADATTPRTYHACHRSVAKSTCNRSVTAQRWDRTVTAGNQYGQSASNWEQVPSTIIDADASSSDHTALVLSELNKFLPGWDHHRPNTNTDPQTRSTNEPAETPTLRIPASAHPSQQRPDKSVRSPRCQTFAGTPAQNTRDLP